ncbi:MAG: hypothetical protein RIB98_18870 [Acidimicrobiales bacterium]
MEPQSPPNQPPTSTPVPTESKRWPIVVATGLVGLLAGAAVGWFVPDLIDDDTADDVAAETEITAPPETVAPVETTLPAGTPPPGTVLVAHHDGTFQVAVPEGWEATSTYFMVQENPTLSAIADPTSDDGYYAAGGLGVNHLATSGTTPESALDALPASSRCPDIEPREDYAHGSFVGRIERASGCANGYELWRIAVPLEDGSVLVVAGAVLSDDPKVLNDALDTFAPVVEESAEVVRYADCMEIEESDDPSFPYTMKAFNYSGADITYGYVDPGTGQPTEDLELLAGFNIFRFSREGDTYRFNLPAGPADYVVTSEPTQCVLVTPDGVSTRPSSDG